MQNLSINQIYREAGKQEKTFKPTLTVRVFRNYTDFAKVATLEIDRNALTTTQAQASKRQTFQNRQERKQTIKNKQISTKKLLMFYISFDKCQKMKVNEMFGRQTNVYFLHRFNVISMHLLAYPDCFLKRFQVINLTIDSIMLSITFH